MDIRHNELSYDGHGINGPDMYRTRIANFRKQEDADKYGPLFAAAAELLKSLRQLVKEIDPTAQMNDPELSSHRPVIAARAAIAQAEHRAALA